MTDEAINTAIKNYVRDQISPKPAQRSYIEEKYDELQKILSGRCFQSGSYARFTAVHPVKDLDVIWVTTDHDITDHPRLVLEKTANFLEKQYKGLEEKPQITIQDHSITLIFEDDDNGFAIDVVPGIPQEKENDNGETIYCVPEIQKMSHHQRRTFSGTARWILSDPKGYISAATRLEKATSGTFRKTAKFLKAWRQKYKEVHGDKFRLKSFHIELIVADYLSSNPSSTLLEAIVESMGKIAQAIQQPQYSDRANSDQFVDDYIVSLTPEERNLILKLQSEGHAAVANLQSASDENSLTKLLDSLTQPGVSSASTARSSIVSSAHPIWAA